MTPISKITRLKFTLTLLLLVGALQFSFGQNYQVLDILEAEKSGLAEITHTAFDIGGKAQIFDADPNSLARSANINPMVITITFQEPISLVASNIKSSNYWGESNWVLETSNTVVDLDTKTGTYHKVLDRQIRSDVIDSVGFISREVKVVRLTLTRQTGDNYVHLKDWRLVGQVNLNALTFKKRVITRAGNLFTAIDTMELLETWWASVFVEASANGIPIKIPSEEVSWAIQDTSIAEFRWVENEYKLQALKKGETQISGTYKGLSANFRLKVNPPVRPVEYEEIDPYLKELDPCAVKEQRVVIIRYMPTTDKINLDRQSLDWDISINSLRERINAFDRRVKFMLTEGSKFQGYKNSSATPALGYKVIDVINVYEPLPPGKATGNSTNAYFPDYYQIVERFNGEEYVDKFGVDEFWLWGWHNDEIAPVESNMSSPTTGDISNSNRFQDDLPVYNHTYVLYNYNFKRTQAEAVHNHGHQLESILSHANHLQDNNTILFWGKFVGTNADPDIDCNNPSFGCTDDNHFRKGRAGWTHMPPNTTKHYDYLNTSTFFSDIEDWRPDEKGEKRQVSLSTWEDIQYDWPDGNLSSIPQKAESQWYIYWMQNMPGFGNTIPHGEKYMSNWWEFTADWDNAIQGGLGLYGNDPAPVPPEISVSLVQGVTCPGEANGQASIQISGDDSANYDFQWDNGETTPQNTSLAVGIHQVTVTNEKGCKQEYEIEVPAPDTFVTEISMISQPSCPNSQDGALQIAAQGESSRFTFQWSTGDTASAISGIGAGTYEVTVMNENGCAQFLSTIVNEPEAISADINIDQELLCFGDQNGVLSVSASGGTGTLTYLWNTGDTLTTLSDLQANTYTVQISDEKECNNDFSFILSGPAPITASFEIVPDTNNLALGAVQFQLSGGSGNYSFVLNDTLKLEEAMVSGLVAGDYLLTVEDEQGCSASFPFVVNLTTGLDQSLFFENLNVFPNPVRAQLFIQGKLKTKQSIQVQLLSPEGKMLFSEQFSKLDFLDTKIRLGAEISSGIYILRLLSNEGVYTERIIKL